MNQDMLDDAIRFSRAGFTVIPVRDDGSKAPAVEWRAYIEKAPSDRTLFGWFDHTTHGIGVVCGPVSGGAELAEVEGRAMERMPAVRELAANLGLSELLARVENGYSEQSPSGGLHLLYRVEWGDTPPAGNTKLASARRDALGKRTVLAETRGMGGYVVVAPTPGTHHKSGRGWTMLAGSPETVAVLSVSERDALLGLLRSLDESHEDARPATPRLSASGTSDLDPSRAGDDFELSTPWTDILRDGVTGRDGSTLLAPLGWELVEALHGGDLEDDDEPRMWRHPDATNDQSASTGYADDRNRLFVFTTSTVFESEVPYTKFGAYAELAHNGDHVEAARALGEAGYGDDARSWAGLIAEPVSELIPELPRVPAASLAGQATQSGSTAVPPMSAPPAWRKPTVEPVSLPWTDLGLSERIARQEGAELRYLSSVTRWLAWDGTRWRPDDLQEHVRRAVGVIVNMPRFEGSLYSDAPTGKTGDGPSERDSFEKWARDCQSQTRIKAAVTLLSAKQGVAVSQSYFDSDLSLINFQNGTLDLNKLTIQPHNPANHLTKLVDYSFDENATAPTWDAFLRVVFPDEADRDFMQRAAGYSLTGMNNERAMFMLYGPAATGKSKFLDGLSYAFSEYAHTASASTFMAKRAESDGPNPGLRALEGPRIVFMSETNRQQAWDEALVKRITGGDSITTRSLYAENATFRPTGAMWLATNAKPYVTGDDGAIYTRLLLMPCMVQIPESEQDRELAAKLRAERAGIMAWAVRGLRMYRAEGLKPSKNSRAALEEYRAEQDTVSEFLNEHTERGNPANDFASVKRLYEAYVDWASNESVTPLGRNRFSARLEVIGFVKGKRREAGQPDAGTGGPVYGFYGVVCTHVPMRQFSSGWGG